MMRDKIAIATSIVVALLFGIANSQNGCNVTEPWTCFPLQLFEIDGNYYSNESDEYSVDWITVLDGYRINRTANNAPCGAWSECQNQCQKDTYVTNPDLYTDYWESGVFCDTFGVPEQSLLATSDDTNPYGWVPLNVQSAGPAKTDLTNAYYVGSDVDMIMCAAMERISTSGASYVDFEFTQRTLLLSLAECGDQIFTQEWKCTYPDRTDGDFQISFILGNAVAKFSIKACRWNSSIVEGSGDCGGAYWDLVYLAESNALGDPILTGPIKAALNTEIIQASPFGYIDDQGSIYGVSEIPPGAFIETCIDWRELGAKTMCFDGLIVKTKASATGSLKDTGGVIPFDICGNVNLTHTPTTSASPTNNPTPVPIITPYPTPQPTDPTLDPTTSDPTTATPTQQPTTAFPTAPTDVPTDDPTTAQPTTAQPTTPLPTTTDPTTADPTTADPTQQPTTSQPTTVQPTTSDPTTAQPTTGQPTTTTPTTAQPTTTQPTASPVPTFTPYPTPQPTTSEPTTQQPTTDEPTSSQPTASPVPTFTPYPTPQPVTSNPTSQSESSTTSQSESTTSSSTSSSSTASSTEATMTETDSGDEGGVEVDDGSGDTALIIGVVVGILALCCCLILGLLWWLNERSKKKEDELDKAAIAKHSALATGVTQDGDVETPRAKDENADEDESEVDETEMADLKKEIERAGDDDFAE